MERDLKNILITSILLFILNVAQATQAEFLLSEGSLLKILKESPESDKIKAERLGTEVIYKIYNDSFSWSLNGTAASEKTSEKSVGTFPTSKSSSVELGVNKVLSYGVNFGVGYTQKKSTASFPITDAASSRFVGKISIDLFKNFLGRTARSNLEEVRVGYKAGRLLEKLNKKALELKVRGLYWKYVSSAESREVAMDLLESAKKQLVLVKKKRKSGIADAGDIARFSAQVSERSAQIFQFEGSMKQTEVEFKEILPSLSSKILKLLPYSKKAAMKSFFQCLTLIQSQPETPKAYSLFDELIEVKREQFGHKRKALLAYSDIDIKFDAQSGYTGVGTDGGTARSNLRDGNFQSIGLAINIPLDGKKNSSEKVQLLLAKAKFNAEVRSLGAKLDASHSTVVDAAKIIKGIIKSRVSNHGFLEKALKSSQKKYRQARITSQQLLQEEDKFLANAIQLINTERAILQLMFDYFTLFTETPCQLNKVI